MSEALGILSAGANWLLERWLENFAGSVEAMAEQKPSMTWAMDGEDTPGDSALYLEQTFSGIPEPLLWLAVPKAIHQDLGNRVLSGAGLESSDEDEKRATCLEILEQSIAGLANELTKKLSREITRDSIRQPSFFPNGLSVVRVTIAFEQETLPPLWIAFSPLLVSWIETKPVPPEEPAPGARPMNDAATDAPASSKTFGLLLDVALPVSVSFGRTELAVKEVLKLTTGSIVELNRSVSEPVDIIVNNCTIAKGEVVVVDGNYGVRIKKIVSRTDRLRTGEAAVARSGES